MRRVQEKSYQCRTKYTICRFNLRIFICIVQNGTIHIRVMTLGQDFDLRQHFFSNLIINLEFNIVAI